MDSLPHSTTRMPRFGRVVRRIPAAGPAWLAVAWLAVVACWGVPGCSERPEADIDAIANAAEDFSVRALPPDRLRQGQRGWQDSTAAYRPNADGTAESTTPWASLANSSDTRVWTQLLEVDDPLNVILAAATLYDRGYPGWRACLAYLSDEDATDTGRAQALGVLRRFVEPLGSYGARPAPTWLTDEELAAAAAVIVPHVSSPQADVRQRAYYALALSATPTEAVTLAWGLASPDAATRLAVKDGLVRLDAPALIPAYWELMDGPSVEGRYWADYCLREYWRFLEERAARDVLSDTSFQRYRPRSGAWARRLALTRWTVTALADGDDTVLAALEAPLPVPPWDAAIAASADASD